MPEPTSLPTDSSPIPKRTCEKCRNDYEPDHFQHGVQDQDCVCKRCLIAMGYKVK